MQSNSFAERETNTPCRIQTIMQFNYRSKMRSKSAEMAADLRTATRGMRNAHELFGFPRRHRYVRRTFSIARAPSPGRGFNRWLVPPAALAIHLCIGMAYGFSVFWLPMTKLLPGANAAACKGQVFFAELVDDELQLDGAVGNAHLRDLHRDARHFGRDLGRLARTCRPAQGRVLSRRSAGAAASSLLGLAVTTHQLWLVYLVALLLRHRPGPRLHHAGLDADQMVPRPARHGHRLRHHGLWRRRDDRRAAGRLADGQIRQQRRSRRRARADGHGRASISSP